MIRPIRQYCRDEVWPRFGSIFLSMDMFLAIAAGFWLALMREHAAVAHLRPSDVGTIGLTYSTIAFGFSLAGLTIALTLPDRRFVKTLAAQVAPGATCNAFSNLLFVFSWTAFVHWLLVVASVVVLVHSGVESVLMPEFATKTHRGTIGVFGFLFAYGISQFVAALLALSQVGRLYISELLRPDDL